MPKTCCSTNVYSVRITVEENGKKATFLNPNKEKYTKTQVDGCLIINEIACDWWIVRCDSESVLVELKGRDVSHALDQIEATFQYLRNHNLLTPRRAGLIVCTKPSQHPAFTAKVQRVKNRLATKYDAPLHIVRGNREYEINHLLSHRGPF